MPTTADVWEVPEDSTISAVAARIIREQNRKAPSVFVYNSDSANRGRNNAAKTSHNRAVERRQAREKNP